MLEQQLPRMTKEPRKSNIVTFIESDNNQEFAGKSGRQSLLHSINESAENTSRNGDLTQNTGKEIYKKARFERPSIRPENIEEENEDEENPKLQFRESKKINQSRDSKKSFTNMQEENIIEDEDEDEDEDDEEIAKSNIFNTIINILNTSFI